MDKRFSEKIILLSFIGAVLVVFVHATNIEQYTPSHKYIFILEELISSIGRFAVPFFFFVSAFFATNQFSLKQILKKRFKSILLPYFSYNTIYTFLFLLTSYLFAKHMNNPSTETDWIRGIFLYKYNSVGWFAFQLSIYTCITPFLANLFTKTKTFAVSFLLILFIMSAIQMEHSLFRTTGLFFYSLGIFAKIYYPNFIMNLPISNKMKILVASLLLIFSESYYWYNYGTEESINIIFRLPITISMFLFADFIKIKPKYFMGFTFFMYLGHIYLLEIIQKIVSIKLYPIINNCNLIALIDFFGSTFLTIFILVTFAKILDKINPSLPYILQLPWLCLNGFRQNRVKKD